MSITFKHRKSCSYPSFFTCITGFGFYYRRWTKSARHQPSITTKEGKENDNYESTVIFVSCQHKSGPAYSRIVIPGELAINHLYINIYDETVFLCLCQQYTSNHLSPSAAVENRNYGIRASSKKCPWNFINFFYFYIQKS